MSQPARAAARAVAAPMPRPPPVMSRVLAIGCPPSALRRLARIFDMGADRLFLGVDPAIFLGDAHHRREPVLPGSGTILLAEPILAHPGMAFGIERRDAGERPAEPRIAFRRVDDQLEFLEILRLFERDGEILADMNEHRPASL